MAILFALALTAQTAGGYARPELLVDINNLPGLDQHVQDPDGSIRVGALCRHADLERSALLPAHQPTMAAAAPLIADPIVRTRGTLVGSLCHADPQGDWASVVTALGGHVVVDDQSFISANCVVHQFVRVGRLTMLRGLSRTSRDVPPFCIMDFTHIVRGINRIGLRRAGFTAPQIRALHGAFVTLFRSRRNLRLAMAELDASPNTPEVDELLAFIRASKRGVCRGPGAQTRVGRL